MRLFIGIFPPKTYLDYFRDVMREFDEQRRNLQPVNLEQIHLTLRFVGTKVSDNSKNAIVEELRKRRGQFPKPVIELESLSFGFPRQHDPRVILANVKENDELHDLVDTLHKIIRNTGMDDTILWKQQLDNNYHISIARLKESRARSVGRDVKQILDTINIPMPKPFQAEEIAVMQSIIPHSGAPVYKRLEGIAL